MGIDACMFLKLKRESIGDDELRAAEYRLCCLFYPKDLDITGLDFFKREWPEDGYRLLQPIKEYHRCDVPMQRYNAKPSGSWSCECGDRVIHRDGEDDYVTLRDRQERKHALEIKAQEALKEKDPETAVKLQQAYWD